MRHSFVFPNSRFSNQESEMNVMHLFYMAGTEGTGEYVVLIDTTHGRVGYRNLGGNRFRVRVEPKRARKTLVRFFPPCKWKQPGDAGQDRFSIVVDGEEALKSVLSRAVKALTRGKRTITNVNPVAPSCMIDGVVDVAAPKLREELVQTAQHLKVRFANRRWKLSTLACKIAAAEAEIESRGV
jgi:hypothetical protein